MKIIIISNNKKRINSFFKWLIYMFGHMLVLISVSVLFRTFYIDNAYYGLYGLLATIIISILNITIKPLIILLTLPLTALTLGLFYPFINVFILKITDFILGDHFMIPGIGIAFIIAIIISIMNILMDNLIIGPILRKGEIR
jgi:putative membrane protein